MSKCLHVGELEEKDRKRYKADFDLKVSKIARSRNTGLIRNVRRSVKAYYDQNRELILASKQAQYQANPKENPTR